VYLPFSGHFAFVIQGNHPPSLVLQCVPTIPSADRKGIASKIKVSDYLRKLQHSWPISLSFPSLLISTTHEHVVLIIRHNHAIVATIPSLRPSD